MFSVWLNILGPPGRISMNAYEPMTAHQDDTLEVVFQGKLSTKVEIADTFRSAYRVLDQLCDGRYSRFCFTYSEDFEVSPDLQEEFRHAAEEAFAYKEALVFGRPVHTTISGLSQIQHPFTRELAGSLHQRGRSEND